MDEAERIADKLTNAQRKVVVTGKGYHVDVVSKEVEPLWFVIRKIVGGVFAISLNELGLRVRTILETRNAE